MCGISTKVCLIPLKGTTTARDVCNALLKFGEKNDLTWENLVSLCTDGAPSMLGRQAGFVALFRQEIGKPNLISYHCIIHRQALCTKAGCGLQDTMKTVVESVNLIRARSLNHRRFQNHLAALDDAEFGDVLFYNSVRWLSRGAFLERFAALLPHMVSFLKEIDHPVSHLEDDKFRVRLCALTDIFGHLNKLDLLLQGRHKLLCNLYEAVKGFEDKVTLFKVHAEGGNFCTSSSPENSVAKTMNVSQTPSGYLVMFLTAWRPHSADDLLTSLLSMTSAASLHALLLRSQLFAKHCRKRLQSTKQRCRTISLILVPGIKNLFNTAKDDLVLFWATRVPVRFPLLIEAAQTFMVLFGSTWSCESGLSAINHIKNNLRCRLKDTRLRDLLRFSISPLCPQFGQLSKNMQHHTSH